MATRATPRRVGNLDKALEEAPEPLAELEGLEEQMQQPVSNARNAHQATALSTRMPLRRAAAPQRRTMSTHLLTQPLRMPILTKPWRSILERPFVSPDFCSEIHVVKISVNDRIYALVQVSPTSFSLHTSLTPDIISDNLAFNEFEGNMFWTKLDDSSTPFCRSR